ncbi:MAG: exo-alpha-sialidase [Bacteroidetes bacterium]|nr:exo-alpha-sialidase [Bacteroidota bacterium]MBS1931115.1 exo-alpha-sialidase [Bacteroidota bacterium]
MTVPTSTALNVTASTSRTITMWFKTTVSTGNARLFAKRANATGTNQSTGGVAGTGIETFIGNSSGYKVGPNARSTGGTNVGGGFNSLVINDGLWHHVAFILSNAVSGQFTSTLYLDGANMTTATNSTANQDLSNLVNIVIGAASDFSNKFPGSVDEIRIYNYAMSATDVSTDKNTSSVSSATTGLLAAWDFEPANVSGTSVTDVSGNGNTGTLVGSPSIVPTASNMQFSNVSLVQTELPAGRGNADQRIISVNVVTTGNASPLNLTALNFTMNGSTNISDVSNVKIYYTGAASRFNTSSLFATVTPAAGTLTATGTQTLASGNNFFWIAYDVSSTATEGDLLDATCESVTVGGTSYPLASPNNTVAGTRTILLANQLLFAPGDAGSSNYRIPAIITAADGSLVTVTDKRWNGSGDLANKIDLVVRRSTDNGQTWSAPLTISNFGGPNGTGDAALVLDKVVNPGTLICMFSANVGFGASTPSVPANIQYCKSTDNGQTWSAPTDVTNQIYASGSSNSYSKTWYAAFVSSGRMHQLRSGRIMAVLDVRQTSAGTQDNFTIHSDDGGTTWVAETSDPTTHGIAAAGQANEAKVVELDNGKILMSTRHAPSRLLSTSTTSAAVAWGTATLNAQLAEPSCNGDLIRYTSTIDGYDKSRLLQSIPNNSGTRKNVSVFISYDEGTTWNTSKTIYPQASAYSSLTILPDGTIGMYYENGEYGDIYDMYFVRFSLNWLTNGADTYTPSTTLPLSLLSFKGNLSHNNKQVDLQWTTTNELNVSHFDIEFSTDGVNFNKVGVVNASNTTAINNYSFSHTNLPVQSNIIYYRLKSVDIDGKFTYSEILKFRLSDDGSVSIYPNPVNDKLLINAPAFKNGILQVIVAGNGSIVKTMTVPGESFTVDLATLSKGAYIIKLTNGTSEKTMKIIKE